MQREGLSSGGVEKSPFGTFMVGAKFPQLEPRHNSSFNSRIEDQLEDQSGH